jgi:hypothetical protein
MEENKRIKSPDEVFCRSCGELIRKEAEICPHCGVRNLYTSPVSDNVSKDYGLLLSVLYIGGIILFIPSFSSNIITAALSSLGIVIIFIISIILVYKDAKYLGAKNPESWAIGVLLLWIIILPMYIFKRKSLANQEEN